MDSSNRLDGKRLLWLNCPWCLGWMLATPQLPQHTCAGLRAFKAKHGLD